MTVEELIEELKQMPPTALIVLEFDNALSYDFVGVAYSGGEVIIHVEGEEETTQEWLDAEHGK